MVVVRGGTAVTVTELGIVVKRKRRSGEKERIPFGYIRPVDN